MLIGIGFLVILACFAKCCALHTPSSNPRMPKNLYIADTLTRPMDTLRRQKRKTKKKRQDQVELRQDQVELSQR